MIIATYKYPDKLVPEFHMAIYQLLVGIEQGHPRENMLRNSKRLRDLADKHFVEYERQATTQPTLSENKG